MAGGVRVKLYFAGAESWHHLLIGQDVKSALFSYYFLTEAKKDMKKVAKPLQYLHDAGKSVFLDSGGFSAFTKGVQIDLCRYGEFIKANESDIDVAANLDVIGDFAASMKNQEALEAMGVKPLPVFHFGGNLADLRALLSSYDYIALGGLVPHARNRPKLMNWLDKCFDVIRLDAKIHGFGMTGIDILKRYPWYSCDSTSWLSGAKQGSVYSFNNNNGKMDSHYHSDKQKVDHKSFAFMDQGDKRWSHRLVNAIKQWAAVEKYITALWTKRGITWND